jgi:hypothetical protein
MVWEKLNPDRRSGPICDRGKRQARRQPGAWAGRPLPGNLALPSGYHRHPRRPRPVRLRGPRQRPPGASVGEVEEAMSTLHRFDTTGVIA